MTDISYVTIVGRTNVGKSTLFNKLIKQKKAITHNRPGVTRDRLYGHVKWDDTRFGLIDTAGLALNEDDEFTENLYQNVQIGIEEGDLILFLVDGKEGLASYDYEIALKLQKQNKPVIVVKNKSEKDKDYENIYDLYEFGFEDVLAVSAKYGRGIYDLLDKIVEKLSLNEKDVKEEKNIIKLAITGKPNAGKSTLLNSFIGKKRSVVSETAGTTRDTIDEIFKRNKQKYLLIDTAGIRRKSRVKDRLEKYMVMRSLKAIDRSDVVIHLIDAEEGFTNQDDKILGYADEVGKCIVIAVNKWDKIKRDEYTYEKYVREIRTKAKFLNYASIYFISAKYKKNLFKLIDIAKEIYKINSKEIKPSVVNDFLKEISMTNPHPIKKNKRIKIKHGKQIGTNPPFFVFFSNYPKLIHFGYKRFIKNSLREEFGFWGSDIKIKYKRS